MKKLFFLFVALLATTCLWAYDFEVDGIYYNYLEDNNVEVTYRAGYCGSYDNEYSSAVSIPSTVTYYGTTYNVTNIGEHAFHECRSLTSVTIPNSVTNIGSSAFWGCSSLTSITIGNSVTSIGSGAFYGTGIYNDNSNWENSVLYISNYLIQAKESISGTYTIKEDTRLIANAAFYNCSSLTSVTIPNSVTSIGDNAFQYCSSLTSITIPYSVTSIGNEAFQGCDSLTKTNYTGDIAGWCSIKFGDSYANPTYYSNNLYINDQEIKDLVIPNTVDSIHYNAFRNCYSLTSVTIPNSVTHFGDAAFFGCRSLTSVTIPNSVTSIGEGAFQYCYSLTSITIGKSVTSIGDDAFGMCTSLKKTNYSGDIAGWCDIKFGSYNANPMYYSHNLYINDQEIKDLVIPNTVDSVHHYAFYHCEALTSVTIGNSVTSIGYHAFDGCDSLTSVTLNSNDIVGRNYIPHKNSIGSIFGSQVKEYVIGDNVTSIGESAFYYDSLTYITIGKSVRNIGYRAFGGCFSITKTNYTGDLASWCNIKFDSNPICNSGNLYINNQEVKDLVIPNTVDSIHDMAFNMCTSLTSITIPNSVTSIGNEAFYGCTSLDTITCHAITPPILGKLVFYNCEKSTLLVPCEALSDYQAHEQWRRFSNILCLEEENDTNVENTHTQSPISNCQKLLRNGQVYILKDNKVYTLMGAEIQ